MWDEGFRVCGFLLTQFRSVAQLCPTLCDPMNHSTPGLPVHHKLPVFTQTHAHRVGDAIQPSHPLSSPSPPAPNPSQHQGLFKWVSSFHQVAKVLQFHLQHQTLQWTPRTYLLQDGLVGAPCSPRDSQESSPTPQFTSWLGGGEKTGQSVRNLVLSLKLPSFTWAGALAPTEELKYIAMYIPWGILKSILKSKDITWLIEVCIVKAKIFLVVRYGYDSWIIKKAECRRTDAFELCWRRLLSIPWTARRSKQSILKEISPDYSLAGLMQKLRL